MRILVHSRTRPASGELALVDAEFVDRLEALLPLVDALSLHAPATPETRGLIDRTRLALLPPHAVVVNTARGELVDEPALIDALQSGRLAGAGLDVYVDEPRVPAGLLGLENVVLLPHLGSATEETRTAMGMRAVENLRAFFRGERPPDRVD
jgi:glyoxylate reductase